MTELDHLIQIAFANPGNQEAANKVYLKFLQTQLFVPIQQENSTDEPFLPLFSKIESQYFMLAFDTMAKLQTWAGDYLSQMNTVELSGHEIIAGINNDVFLCLNLGTVFHKEFSPDEIKYLKNIVIKIENLKHANKAYHSKTE